MFLNYFSKSYYLTVTYGACSVLVRCFFRVSYSANCLLYNQDTPTKSKTPFYNDAVLDPDTFNQAFFKVIRTTKNLYGPDTDHILKMSYNSTLCKIKKEKITLLTLRLSISGMWFLPMLMMQIQPRSIF